MMMRTEPEWLLAVVIGFALLGMLVALALVVTLTAAIAKAMMSKRNRKLGAWPPKSAVVLRML